MEHPSFQTHSLKNEYFNFYSGIVGTKNINYRNSIHLMFWMPLLLYFFSTLQMRWVNINFGRNILPQIINIVYIILKNNYQIRSRIWAAILKSKNNKRKEKSEVKTFGKDFQQNYYGEKNKRRIKIFMGIYFMPYYTTTAHAKCPCSCAWYSSVHPCK